MIDFIFLLCIAILEKENDMDFASKVRAGRAILQWTVADLATQTGMSSGGLHRVENGNSATDRTRRLITRAFERQGVIFTRAGVEQDDGPIAILTDENPEACYLTLLDDVARVLGALRAPELLIAHADDRRSTPAINDCYREMRKAGARMRQLVEAGNTYLLGPLEEYRCIPQAFFINRVTLIYGDKVASVTSGENVITITHDKINAARERNTFHLLWSMLEPPTKSTADEAF